MIVALQVRDILQGHVPRKTWISSDEIFAIVEMHGHLDDQDRKPKFRGSVTPRWKTIVRGVLASELRKGKVRSRKHAD